MNDTPGIEEVLQERLSEIVNKDLSKRQVEKIVELFATDKANPLHRVVEVKSAEEILDQYWHYEAGKPLEHWRVLQAMEEYASQFKHSLPVSDEGWISCEDKPLVTVNHFGWKVNEGVPDEFLAAIEVHNNKTGKKYWWIRHCIIEDEIGLCIVGDDIENVPAGWEITDVEFYQPLPTPPNKPNSK